MNYSFIQIESEVSFDYETTSFFFANLMQNVDIHHI